MGSHIDDVHPEGYVNERFSRGGRTQSAAIVALQGEQGIFGTDGDMGMSEPTAGLT